MDTIENTKTVLLEMMDFASEYIFLSPELLLSSFFYGNVSKPDEIFPFLMNKTGDSSFSHYIQACFDDFFKVQKEELSSPDSFRIVDEWCRMKGKIASYR